MKEIKITLVIDPFFQKNQIFNEFNSIVNRDDCQRPWIELRKELNLARISLNTLDITPISDADIVMFINVPVENDPYLKEAINKDKKVYCVITELDLIHKANARRDLTKLFDKIFTYQTDFVDHHKVFKLNYSFDFKKKVENFKIINYDNRKNLCALIAGNKKLNHINELYSKRVEVIKWFEQNHPKELDLYGMGWNRMLLLRRIPLEYKYLGYFRKFIPDYFKAYLGPIKKKDEVLKEYKFSFCFENAVDVKGWITEKIFDSLFNGCVPIYLGAREINDIVDKSCFIHMKDFTSYEKLYDYLSNMNGKEYNTYMENIKRFLEEKSIEEQYEFGIPYFVKTIKTQILKSINND